MKKGIAIFLISFFVTGLNAQQKSLDFYIEKAIQNSPVLKEYQGLIMAGKIDSMRIVAETGPQVNALSNNYLSPVIKGWGFDKAVTDGANLNAVVSVSVQLTGRQNIQNQFDAVNLQSQSLKNAGKISELDLRKEITDQYLAAYEGWQLYSYNLEILDVFIKGEPVLKELTAKGVYRQSDYLSFVVNMQKQEMSVSELRNQCQGNIATLNYLCGIEDTTLTPLEDPALKVEGDVDFQNTLFYSKFFIDSLRLKNADRQIDFSYKPKISLTGEGGYLSSLAYLPYRNFGINAGVSLSIPIYDGGQRKMQHDRIAIEEMNRNNYQQFFCRQYNQQTGMLFQKLNSCQKQQPQISKHITYARALLETDQALLQTGDISIADYIMAVGNYLEACNMLTENTISSYRIMNQINYWKRAN